MGNPYVGEIRMFAGSFAPTGWAFCDGQLLPIAENETLFQLIGTTYGGDGQETFALPDLRGRVPVHVGLSPSGIPASLGDSGGTETVTLTTQQLPSHSHATAAGVPAINTSPVGRLVADTGATLIYGDGPGTAQASAAATPAVGGSQPHDNLMPYTCISFIISLFGIFPSQS